MGRFSLCTVSINVGFRNQGPALLQSLSILKNFDLQSMGQNSLDYLHTVIEAVKLAFADREQWYGDPFQVEVPAAELLSDSYGRLRARLIRFAYFGQ